MSRTRPEGYILQDRRTHMYWCQGIRDDRNRGWHLLRAYATQYHIKADAVRELNAIECGAPARARIVIVPVYQAAESPAIAPAQSPTWQTRAC